MTPTCFIVGIGMLFVGAFFGALLVALAHISRMQDEKEND